MPTGRKILIGLGFALLGVVLVGYRFQPQKNAASSWSTAADASTDCMADATDAAGATDATASLTCLNTGDVTVQGWNQATVHFKWSRNAGTAVNMQCDTSIDNGSNWVPVMLADSSSVLSIRKWVYTTSVEGRGQANFEVNADKLRCRWTITNGNSNDKLSYLVRQATDVKP